MSEKLRPYEEGIATVLHLLCSFLLRLEMRKRDLMKKGLREIRSVEELDVTVEVFGEKRRPDEEGIATYFLLLLPYESRIF